MKMPYEMVDADNMSLDEVVEYICNREDKGIFRLIGGK